MMFTRRIVELTADDYRMLFGSPAAVAGAGYLQSGITDPRSVPGLKDFLENSWPVKD